MTFDLCVGFCLVILDVMPDVLGKGVAAALCSLLLAVNFGSFAFFRSRCISADCFCPLAVIWCLCGLFGFAVQLVCMVLEILNNLFL